MIDRSIAVLVADDEAINRVVFEQMLQHLGHTVFLAANGRTAVEIAVVEKIAVGFLDLNMPGLDGYETARSIVDRLGGHAPPLFALTAYRPDEVQGAARSAGFTDILQKPLVTDTLQRILADL